ncbi:MAG: hypothetical protein KC586_07640 [Myxococcales bacterium]|nr:hypothetical protein [Myxococcales bacterium]
MTLLRLSRPVLGWCVCILTACSGCRTSGESASLSGESTPRETVSRGDEATPREERSHRRAPEGPTVIPTSVHDSAELGASPSGLYRVHLSSSQEGETGQTQPGVSWESRPNSGAGTGLAPFPFPRVPMSATWTGEHELVLSYPDDLPVDRAAIDRWHNRSFGQGGRGRVVYRAVPRSTIPEPTWTRESEMSGVRTPQERGVIGALTTNGERTYSFVYADAEEPDSSVAWLQERGYAGNGYTWGGIVYGLVMRHAPATWPLLFVDPESGALFVSSDDEEAIATVARLVARAKREPAELEAAIERAVRDGAMIE